jgi:hypothetical protein
MCVLLDEALVRIQGTSLDILRPISTEEWEILGGLPQTPGLTAH